ncbi:cytochrome o ubiquinol oxidase subunit III [Pantoea sp. Mhis]|uniref:cytochrome o ubiquinol oxidase subunit III n=1 Tax=Pantoea sp. Mhis TaxID=2576759 RepID=UPI001F46B2DE|nr:cytochrome o ubiquinol oxidase subunit III [Pantoea sp. Mhis]
MKDSHNSYTKHVTNHKLNSNKIFGFWLYLMSDCIIFATLFATYIVMVNNTAGGPSGKDIFVLPFILIETTVLLCSSITYGMAVVSINKYSKRSTIKWLLITFLLGITFVIMEIYEFHHLILKGLGPNRSAFLSSFFTLVGTHGLHVLSGVIWMAVLIFQIAIRGFTVTNYIRIICLSLFWHFLDIVWICVFTIVYLIGAMQ